MTMDEWDTMLSREGAAALHDTGESWSVRAEAKYRYDKADEQHNRQLAKCQALALMLAVVIEGGDLTFERIDLCRALQHTLQVVVQRGGRS